MDKVIVIGDLHGMYEEFLALAEALQLCDSTGNWIAQNTLLVLTGDVCDRGYNSKDIYRTLMVWQDAAHSFSSKIVFIIGNHEVLNMIGRSTYTTPQEAAAYDTMTQAFFPGGWVREWLEKQHSCFQFGQIVFGHGDLPVVLAELSVKEINMRTMNAISRLGEQQKLSNAGKTDSSIIQNHPELFSEEYSILWGRQAQYYLHENYELFLNNFLKKNSAKLYICGHTPTKAGEFQLLHDSQYLCVDTGMVFTRRGFGSISAARISNTCIEEVSLKEKKLEIRDRHLLSELLIFNQ